MCQAHIIICLGYKILGTELQGHPLGPFRRTLPFLSKGFQRWWLPACHRWGVAWTMQRDFSVNENLSMSKIQKSITKNTDV